MLRMGRSQNEVDNISSGGICTDIDINTGKFGDFAMSYSAIKIEKHPDTQYKFQNSGINRWDEIQRFTLDAADKLPFFTYIGWDIALTEDGPLALEINLAFGDRCYGDGFAWFTRSIPHYKSGLLLEKSGKTTGGSAMICGLMPGFHDFSD